MINIIKFAVVTIFIAVGINQFQPQDDTFEEHVSFSSYLPSMLKFKESDEWKPKILDLYEHVGDAKNLFKSHLNLRD